MSGHRPTCCSRQPLRTNPVHARHWHLMRGPACTYTVLQRPGIAATSTGHSDRPCSAVNQTHGPVVSLPQRPQACWLVRVVKHNPKSAPLCMAKGNTHTSEAPDEKKGEGGAKHGTVGCGLVSPHPCTMGLGVADFGPAAKCLGPDMPLASAGIPVVVKNQSYTCTTR